MAHVWSWQEDFIRLELLGNGLSYLDIANEMNIIFKTNQFTKDSVRNRSRRTNTSIVDIKPTYQTFQEKWDCFCDFIGQKERQLAMGGEEIGRANTVVFADLHCPDHNIDALVEAVEATKGVARRCVIAGDFLDTGSFSPHFRREEITVKEELQIGKMVARYLNDSYDEVIFIHGNHENWYNKAKKRVPLEFRPLLKDYLIEYILADLPNCRFDNKFFIQIGDCVIGHPSMFRQKRWSDVIQSFNYFNDWQGRLGLREIGCYIHAHTHKLGEMYIENKGRKVKLFESGCFCLPSDHLKVGSTVNYAPPMEGYVLLIQDDDGGTILNETRGFVLQSQYQVKRHIENNNPITISLDK